MIEGVYADIEFGAAPNNRPFVFINMVATIDGKTVSGKREEPVADIGSEFDHKTMRQIESSADAVLIGAGSLRATKNLHYGPRLLRVVVTNSGNLPYDSKFFTENPTGAFVAISSDCQSLIDDSIKTIVAGNTHLDWVILLNKLRIEHGVNKLLIEGGSEINAALLKADLVDELFLTIAPLVKLGAYTPTYAGGVPFDRNEMTRFDLISTIVVENEVFLRYKRHR